MEITNLKNVFVNKISLVSKDENPAVPKSNIKYALFKTVKKADPGPSKLDTLVKTMQGKQKLGKIITKLEEWDYLDICMWWDNAWWDFRNRRR